MFQMGKSVFLPVVLEADHRTSQPHAPYLRLGLLGPKPVRRRALLFSKGLLFIRAQASKAQGPIDFQRIIIFFFFFFFFIQPSGHFWGP